MTSGAPHRAIREAVARGAVNAKNGHNVAGAGLLDILHVAGVHAHQPRHLSNSLLALTFKRTRLCLCASCNCGHARQLTHVLSPKVYLMRASSPMCFLPKFTCSLSVMPAPCPRSDKPRSPGMQPR